MISLDEARHRLIQDLPGMVSESVGLEDALGRVAAVDLRAPSDLPGESRSSLDGYAVRSDETAGASGNRPVHCLPTPWTVTAGHAPMGRLEEGHCVRIMTGAVMPEGADAVVAQEFTRLEGHHLVLTRPVKVADGVVPRGAEARRGDLLAGVGTVLTPSKLAMVAAFGLEKVPVAVRPRVALLSTGDEVREPGEPPAPGVSYSNNRLLLGWLVRLNGGVLVQPGVCRDDPIEVCRSLGGVQADLYVTTGGTGKGDRDVVREAWRRLGVSTAFEGIGVSPGKGTMAGFKEGKSYLALPGSPWGGRIIFEELIKLFLWRFQGFICQWPLGFPALLAESVGNAAGICRVLTGHLDMKKPTAVFTPLRRRKGAVFDQVRESIGYMLLEPYMLEKAAGAEVNVQLFDLPILAAALLVDAQRPVR